MDDKDQEPNLDDALVPSTPEVPFSSMRASEASSGYGFKDRDAARHGELNLLWAESLCERWFWMAMSFIFIGAVGFFAGLGFGSSLVQCYRGY